MSTDLERTPDYSDHSKCRHHSKLEAVAELCQIAQFEKLNASGLTLRPATEAELATIPPFVRKGTIGKVLRFEGEGGGGPHGYRIERLTTTEQWLNRAVDELDGKHVHIWPSFSPWTIGLAWFTSNEVTT